MEIYLAGYKGPKHPSVSKEGTRIKCRMEVLGQRETDWADPKGAFVPSVLSPYPIHFPTMKHAAWLGLVSWWHRGFHQAEAPRGTSLGVDRQGWKILGLHKNQLTKYRPRGPQVK